MNKQAPEPPSAGGQFTVVSSLKKKLEQSLLCVADTLLNCYSPDVGRLCSVTVNGSQHHNNKVSQLCLLFAPQSLSPSPDCLVRCMSLLTGVLAGYVSVGVLKEEEACHSQLLTKAKVQKRRKYIVVTIVSIYIVSFPL